MYAAIILPYKIAFINDEIYEWDIFDNCIDSLFLLDVIINFVSAYYDDEDNLITNRRV